MERTEILAKLKALEEERDNIFRQLERAVGYVDGQINLLNEMLGKIDHQLDEGQENEENGADS